MTPAEHSWEAFAGSSSGTELTVISGKIQLDETWAPFIQGTLTIALPDQSALGDLNPHLGGRVFLRLTSRTLEDTPVNRSATFNLGVRTLRVNYRKHQVELTLASDEALLQDFRDFNDGSSHTYGTLYTMAYYTVRDVLTGASIFNDDVSIGGSSVPAGVVFDKTATVWEHISPYITGAGGRLWCDGARGWHVDAALPDIDEDIIISYLTNLIELEVTTDRGGDWADAAAIQYDGTFAWREPTGYSKGVVLQRPTTAFVDYTEVDQLIEERQKAGVTVSCTAVADYIVTPGMNLHLVQDAVTGAWPDAAISNVSFLFPECQMIVVPRVADGYIIVE